LAGTVSWAERRHGRRRTEGKGDRATADLNAGLQCVLGRGGPSHRGLDGDRISFLIYQ
jgi:hypothetical protein